jgi:hypothetical protein
MVYILPKVNEVIMHGKIGRSEMKRLWNVSRSHYGSRLEILTKTTNTNIE